ncbi:uncharacterized protein LOC103706522 isoform X1 [Phoenix dactylifera]|uniref:Uncharacterized protein LOC103706522 isoform X1 n=1 Tax=Phoenix dactylifera TaxID=42345 RepID=A0A8B8J462_PHODC|nr:uncharacterized protein LOC103706522 isoform X1 [Phoenix dactylifera]
MGETLVSSEGSEIEPINLETFRSRLRELSELRINAVNASDDLPSDPKKLLEDCTSDFLGKVKQIESEDPDVVSLGLEDLEAFMELLKKELFSAEEENSRISGEIETLTRTVAGDSAQLDGDIEALACSLKYIDSQDQHYFQFHLPDGRLIPGDTHESSTHMFEDNKFEILELDQRIEKSKINLSGLQDLDYALKRAEAIGQIEYMLSGVKVIELEGTCLRLSLKTPIPTSDSFLLRHKLDCIREPTVMDHELLIEVVDKTLELKSVEIFPSDVFINGIIDTVKSLRDFVFLTGSSLGWFLRQVQHRILLCTLRRLLVKDANNSRHSFEYSDRDETFTAHLVGGVDAFIKICQDWPISNSALKLLSIKTSNSHSKKSISLSLICKVKGCARWFQGVPGLTALPLWSTQSTLSCILRSWRTLWTCRHAITLYGL